MAQAGDIYRYSSLDSEDRYFLFLERTSEKAAASVYPNNHNDSEIWIVIDLQYGYTRRLEYGIYRHFFTKEA